MLLYNLLTQNVWHSKRWQTSTKSSQERRKHAGKKEVKSVLAARKSTSQEERKAMVYNVPLTGPSKCGCLKKSYVFCELIRKWFYELIYKWYFLCFWDPKHLGYHFKTKNQQFLHRKFKLLSDFCYLES